MTAPRLLSPNMYTKNAHNEILKQQIIPVLEDSSPQIELLQRQEQKKSKSQIERLEEAYLLSVSQHKCSLSKADGSHGNAMAAAPALPLRCFTTNRDHSHLDQKISRVQMRIPDVEDAVPGSQNDTEPIELSIKNSTSRVNNVQSLDTTITQPIAGSNQIPIDSTKSQMDLPNFLSDFDKVTKQKHTEYSDPTVTNNSSDDLKQPPQYSPVYRTSRSFDDFHRYLGIGLPPENESSAKLEQSNNFKPSNPSFDSCNGFSTLILQKRPRGQQSSTSAISTSYNDATRSISYEYITKAERKSNEKLLNDAYQEAIKMLPSQPAQQTVQNISTVNSSDQFNIFAQKSATTRAEYSEHNVGREDQGVLLQGIQQQHQPQHQQQHQQQQQQHSDRLAEIPLEHMMFEDFGTFPSCPDSTPNDYGSFQDRTGVVSRPNSVGGGGGTSDDSIGTHSERSSRYGKRKRESPIIYSA
eukprot:jgi/Psemu1/327415/estExt_fgenesh1_pg.C_6490011